MTARVASPPCEWCSGRHVHLSTCPYGRYTVKERVNDWLTIAGEAVLLAVLLGFMIGFLWMVAP